MRTQLHKSLLTSSAAMDLKSMLNESTVARPPSTTQQTLHHPTRQQTYPPSCGTGPSSLAHPASQRERPSQPPRLQPPESCAPSTGYSSAQSPSQHTFASTPSINSGGPHSAFGLSPGQSQLATARDGTPYYNQHPTSFVPSPSTHVPDQGPVQPYQQQRLPSGFPGGASLSSFGVPRESPIPLNGPLPSASRQFSPHASHPSIPQTPLGPPAPFQKRSPQGTQRAASFGLEHVKTHSGGSLGSQYGYDHSDRTMSHHQRTPSRDSSMRQYSYDREREKSMSVSPKTVPQPSPLRQASVENLWPRMTPPPPRLSVHLGADHTRLVSSVEFRLDGVTSSSSATPKDHDRGSSPYQSPRLPTQHSTPSSNSAMPPARSSPAAQRQPALKRAASAISGSSSSPQPPRKRSKRTEIPIFARTARPNKPLLRFIMKESVRSASHVPPSINGHASLNGNVGHAPPVQTLPVAAPAPVEPSDWEPSIMGSTPYEELTRHICDMIYNTIGTADTPTDGAVFEIEAKLGEIHNIEEGRRIRLPVMTETIFDKTKFGPPTRFESSMNVVSISSYLIWNSPNAIPITA